MDYEKKYKEVLSQAKQVYKKPYIAHWDVMKGLIEHLFPEIEESEDERLRKAVAEVVKNFGPQNANPKLYSDMLAWLESLKQRCTWKPSDEQMKQLGWVAKQNKDNMIGKELMTLYNDLKNKFYGE